MATAKRSKVGADVAAVPSPFVGDLPALSAGPARSPWLPWWIWVLLGAWQSRPVAAVGRSILRAPEQPAPRLPTRGARAWDNMIGLPAFAPQDYSVNRLILHGVDDRTNRTYIREVKAFLWDAKRLGATWANVETLDRAVAAYLQHLCYLEQVQPQRGRYLLSGLMHFFPELRGHMAWSARALTSWDRLAAAGEGTPLCRELVAVVVLHMIDIGRLYDAALVLLSYDVFAREQDWLNLRGADVHGSDGDVAIALGVRSRGESSKTGPHQGATIALPLVGRLLRRLAKRVGPDNVLFPISAAEYRKRWWAALCRMGLEAAGPPHRLRHSGAAEFVSRGGSLEMARRRGRWAALSSVQRYTKVHHLTKSRGMLSDERRARGKAFWRAPEKTLRQHLEPWRGSSILADIWWESLQDVTAPKTDMPHVCPESQAEPTQPADLAPRRQRPARLDKPQA